MKKILLYTTIFLLLINQSLDVNAINQNKLNKTMNSFYLKLERKYPKTEDRISNINKIINKVDSILINKKLGVNKNSKKMLILLKSNLENKNIFYSKQINEVNITFLEGWNIYDIDYSLSQKGYINSGEYIAYVNNPEKINKLGEFFDFLNNQETLEGFLYPDTYKINSTALKINELVIKQLENFEEKVYNKILKDLSINEINNLVNLSSIVEKEEKNVNEKSTVAGILKKRLENGWMIGADITVCYPHELTSQECKMVVSKYINEKSQYNTRTKTGLPKTPIGNPSFETINATLNYKETPYWFYLHNIKTGKIYYGKTNSDHEYNKRFMY